MKLWFSHKAKQFQLKILEIAHKVYAAAVVKQGEW